MLDAGLVAGEAVWIGTNNSPLSLGGRGCWSPCWEHSSQFLLPDFPVWCLKDGAFLSGATRAISKNSKELTFKVVHNFFKHLGIHFTSLFEKETIPKENALLLLLFTVGIITLSGTDASRGRFL